MRERTVERRLRQRIEAAGGLALKWVSPAHAAVPDRIVFMPGGRMYLVETKAPNKDQTPLQARVAKSLAKLGFPVVVLDTLEDVDQWVAGIAAEQHNSPIEDLIAEYRLEGCDFDNSEFVRLAALRFVRTLPDSQVRALLYILSKGPNDG